MGEPTSPTHDRWRLVLASASPRRAELLARLDLAPQIRPADIDETPQVGEAPPQLVARLAAAKARAASRGDDAEIVLAADTTVALDGVALGKPHDEADAAAMLRRLSGRTHAVHTAVAVRRGDTEVAAMATTEVTFRALSDTEVAWYVATGEPRDKAGAYALQGAGAALVATISGADTTVIGLPLTTTVELLGRVGVEVLRAPASQAAAGEQPVHEQPVHQQPVHDQPVRR